MSETTPHSNAACELALDYVYGELDDERKRAFEEHLPTCARCQAEVTSFGRVRTATKKVLPAAEPTPQLTGALHAQLMHAAAQRKPKRGVLLSFPRRIVEHPALSAAAMFVIVGGAIAINWSRGKMAMPPAESAAQTTTTAETPAPEAKPEIPALAEPVPVEKKKEEAPAAEFKTAFAKGGGGGEDKTTTIALQTPKGNYAVERAKAHRAVSIPAAAPAPKAEMPAKMKNIVADGKAAKADDALLSDNAARDEAEGGALGMVSGGGVAATGSTRGVAGAKSSAPGDVAHAAGEERAKEQANRPAPSRGYAAATPSTPAAQPAPPPVASAPVPTSSMAERAPVVQKPAAGRSFDSVRKQADELAKTNRCDEAIKLYQELEKAGQYVSPTERVRWVRCLTQRGRQEEAQQRLDELKAEKRVTNAQIQDAERELNDSRRRVDAKKKAKKAPAASDRAVQSEQLQRAAEPAPAQAAPPDATHTKVDSKQQSY